ncbi:MAG TPA: hypothetical protein VM434_10020 [Beijerinckiaceae bacterium]|nr:hypothetical protein [Beijerinckiaceae bacterium]
MIKLGLSVLAASVVAFGLSAAPAAASPLAPVQVDRDNATLVEVRGEKRRVGKRQVQRRAARTGSIRRGSPHADNPSRPPHQQNLGNISGGPRSGR